MEYVMYGKLLAFLRDHRTRQHYYNFSEDSDALTSRDLTVFAYCVARGMEYLGSRGVRIQNLRNAGYVQLVSGIQLVITSFSYKWKLLGGDCIVVF
jgi:hypothetical protein